MTEANDNAITNESVILDDGLTTTVVEGLSGCDGQPESASVTADSQAAAESATAAVESPSSATQSPGVRQGSAPNFCPPVEEGMVVSLKDDKGDVIDLEFLGLVIDDERSYGFFFPLDDSAPMGSGEVIVLQVNSVDEDGQPADFEMIGDEAEAMRIFEIFKEAAKDIYSFE